MRSGAVHPRLVIMVKLATAGAVKSRLARDIGVVRATSFYRHATASLVGRLSSDARWQTLLAISPDTAVGHASFPPHIAAIGQGHGDLGQRMQHVMTSMPPGPVIIIGSDCPAVTNDHIAGAFRRLRETDAAIGPAHDGGYWLIGLRRSPRSPAIFDQVRWSTSHTYDDTVGNMTGLRVGVLETLSDVDHGSDLAELGGRFGRRISAR